jgi:Holliday junction resolvasome RuvABC endonuclease subunit
MKICGIDPSINGTGIYKLELDQNLTIVSYDYLSFTNTKKFETDNVISYKKNQFRNEIDKYDFMLNKIKSFVSDCEYIGIEDYAFAATGNVFDIGEFVGLVKHSLYHSGKKIRCYEPTVIKKFATSKGNADKVRMGDCFADNYGQNDVCFFKNNPQNDKANLSFLPDNKSPKTDIIDAYFIVKLLHLEVRLRHGFDQLKNFDLNTISIFNTVSKSNPVNILARDFLVKE